MKKLMLLSVFAFALLTAGAQATTQDKTKKAPAKKEMKKKKKEHTCTSTCTADKHAIAHGEKGHKCTQECHRK